ncbi:AA10 family lytic polysaccharide monooxygenase CBP21-like [Halictus rubicundus]|uniref:AA10 family lytic polysaccharide monooxygenase CBP21-like n=1 Tax=Halictus rubicundus TaxID=77578 RepID=UPI0040358423
MPDSKAGLGPAQDNSLLKQITTFHGYVSGPASRASLCQLRVNQDCGLIVYEPQSIEAPKGFPNSPGSPPDGKIASGNNSRFKKLDDYGKNRWSSVEFPRLSCYNETHVYFNLTWFLTARHSTDTIRAFVSNENYDTAKPLSRSQLDLSPLCQFELNGKIPPHELILMCTMPKGRLEELKKRKELLLLSVWDINDTGNAFYQVIDLKTIPENVTFESIQRKCRE